MIASKRFKRFKPLLINGLLLALLLGAAHWAWAQTPVGYSFSIPQGNLAAFFRNGPHISAHRGGPVSPGFPENCIETFAHTMSLAPAIIEFDVEMTADSVLILMHDNTLDRTTTGTGPLRQRRWAELDTLRLRSNDGAATPFRIPLFEQALEWTKRAQAVLTVDVKRGVPFERIVRLIEQYELESRAAVITYNERDALEVHRLNPRLIISATMRNLDELERTLAAGIPPQNLLAFVGTREPAPELYERLRQLDIPAILGTLGNLDNMAKAKGDHLYRQWVERGAAILATDRPTEAWKALQQ